MELLKIKQIKQSSNICYDITVKNNHNFFGNGMLIHNCDYRGEIKVILTNLGKEPFYVEKNMKIAQLIFNKYEQVKLNLVKKLSNTIRGKGGFGSTGLK